MSCSKPTPLRGAQADALAVERDDLDEAHRPGAKIRSYLRAFAEEHPKMILFGSRGCGKSTELARLERALGDQFLVVGLDVERNQVQREKLSAEELVLLSGLAIAKAATEVWGLDLSVELRPIEEAIRPLMPEEPGFKVDVPRLMRNLVLFGTTMVGGPAGPASVAVDLLLKTSEAVKHDLEFGGILRVSRDRKPASELRDAVNDLIATVERKGARPPLLLIDNLDRIDVAAHAERLLMDDGLLGSLACALVLTGPNSLRQSSRLRGLGDQYQLATLYHIRCWEYQDPSRADPAGMAKLSEILDLRIHYAARQVGSPLRPEELLSPVARELILSQCGGVVRDLLRLLENSARNAIMGGADRVELTHANAAVHDLRRKLELGLSAESKALLASTALSRDLSGSPLSYQLLDDNFIVVYSNGELWYYPHAALWGRLELG